MVVVLSCRVCLLLFVYKPYWCYLFVAVSPARGVPRRTRPIVLGHTEATENCYVPATRLFVLAFQHSRKPSII